MSNSKILNQDFKNLTMRPVEQPKVVNFLNNTEMTIEYDDGSVDVLHIHGDNTKHYNSFSSLDTMINELFSGDEFLKKQELRNKYPSIHDDIVYGLSQKGIFNIKKIYIMEL